jgi:putative oxidoreductase
MPLIRRIARPMLASMFVVGGVDELRNAKSRAEVADPVVRKIADALPPQAPKDTVTLVRIDAGVKTGAGLLLALGKLPRLSALALAASTVPTTVAGHAFWKEDDPTKRAAQRVHFFKNVSMLGGLLIAAVDTGGKPSLGWRAQHAAHTASDRAHGAATTVSGAAHGASSTVSDKAHDAAGGVRGLAGHVKGALPID